MQLYVFSPLPPSAFFRLFFIFWDIGGHLEGIVGGLEGVFIIILILEGIDDALGYGSTVFIPVPALKVILEGSLLRGVGIGTFLPFWREHGIIINCFLTMRVLLEVSIIKPS